MAEPNQYASLFDDDQPAAPAANQYSALFDEPEAQMPRPPSSGLADVGSGLATGFVSGLSQLGPALYNVADWAAGGNLEKGRRNLQAGAQGLLADVTGDENWRVRPEDIAPMAVGAEESKRAVQDTLRTRGLQAKQEDLANTTDSWDRVGKILSDPALLAEMGGEAATWFLPMTAAGRAAHAAALARGATKEAAMKTAGRVGIAANAPISGGTTGLATQQEVYNMPEEQFQQQFPGMTRDEAANQASQLAVPVAGGLATLASAATRGGLEGLILRGGAGGGLLRNIAQGAGMEAAEEALQSGAEQFAQNVGVGADPMREVPQSAVLGGALGALMGGGVGAFQGRGQQAEPIPQVGPNGDMQPGQLETQQADLLAGPVKIDSQNMQPGDVQPASRGALDLTQPVQEQNDASALPIYQRIPNVQGAVQGQGSLFGGENLHQQRQDQAGTLEASQVAPGQETQVLTTQPKENLDGQVQEVQTQEATDGQQRTQGEAVPRPAGQQQAKIQGQEGPVAPVRSVDRLRQNPLLQQAEKRGTLKIVQSVADLPRTVSDRASTSGGQVAGFVDGVGRAWLVADNIDESKADGVFAHEVGVHVAGLQQKGKEFFEGFRSANAVLQSVGLANVAPSFAQTLDQIGTRVQLELQSLGVDDNALVQALSDPGANAKLLQRVSKSPFGRARLDAIYGAITQGQDLSLLNEETFGYLAEDNQGGGFMRRLISEVKVFLHRLGLDVNLTERDIAMLALNAAKAVTSAPVFPGQAGNRYSLVGQRYGNVVSGARPTGPNATGGTDQLFTSDLASITQDKGHAEAAARAISHYKTLPASELQGTPEEVLGRFAEHGARNLVAMVRMIENQPGGKGFIKITSRWYEAANGLAKSWAKRYGISTRLMAAIFAVNSPSTDWDNNVSRAERILDSLTDPKVRDHKMNREELERFDEMFSQAYPDEANAAKLKKAVSQFHGLRPLIVGRTLGEILASNDPNKHVLAAIWIRVHDGAFRSNKLYGFHPTGRFTKDPLERKFSWADVAPIATSVRLFENDNIEAITEAVGRANKVRNFYNNLVDPLNPHFVTIDTHAVGAAMMKPLSQKSWEVLDNFGMGETGRPYSRVSRRQASGSAGTYGVYDESYTRATEQLKELGLRKNQIQSVVWEGIRKMFPAQFKIAVSREVDAAVAALEKEGVESYTVPDRKGLNANIKAAIQQSVNEYAADRPRPADPFDAVWDKYSRGELTYEQAIQSTIALSPSGGIVSGPQPALSTDAGHGRTSYPRELSGPRLAVRSAGKPGRRDGSGDARYSVVRFTKPVDKLLADIDSGRTKELTAAEWNAIRQALHPRKTEPPPRPEARKLELVKYSVSRVLFEVAPDPNNKELSARWDALSDKEKFDLSRKVAEKIVPLALKLAGTEGRLAMNLGGYQGKTSPSFSLTVADPDKMVELAHILGAALSQDSMMVTSEQPFAGSSPTGLVTVMMAADADLAAVTNMYNKLYELEENGEPLVGGHTTVEGNMAILNFSPLSTQELAARIDAHLERSTIVGTSEVHTAFPQKSEYAYASRGLEEFARQSSLQRQSDQIISAGLGESVGQRRLSRDDIQNYEGAKPRPEATQAIGVHFGRARRDVLDSAFYGSGMPDAAKGSILAAQDKRLRNRIYFYVNAGQGISPESGVGSFAHAVNLRNLYDGRLDPLGLKQGTVDDNEYHSRILDAGFDGLLIPDAFPTLNQHAAVLFGDHKVKSTFLGMGKAGVNAALPVDSVPEIKTPAKTPADLLRDEIRATAGLPSGSMKADAWRNILSKRAPGLLEKLDLNQAEPDARYYPEQLADLGRFSQSRRWTDTLPPEVRSMADKIGAKPMSFMDKLNEFRENWRPKLRQGIVDRYARLLEMDKERFGNDVVAHNAALSSWVLAKMSKAAPGIVEVLYQHGGIRLKDGAIVAQETGNGLNKALEKVASAGELDRYFQWVIANRAHVLAKEGRENLFERDEIDAGMRLNNGTMANGENRARVYMDTYKRYDELNTQVLNIAVQAGLISQEVAHKLGNTIYLPFYRVSDEADSVRGPRSFDSLVDKNVIKRLLGGKEKIGDPLQNILMNWNSLMDASLKNLAAQQALETAESLGIARDVDGKEASEEAVFVRREGKKVFYEVNDALTLEAISALQQSNMPGMLMKALGTAKRALTLGTTMSPTFKIANFLRDTIAVLAVSGISPNVFKNIKRGWSATSNSALQEAEMLSTGGIFRFGTLLEGDPDALTNYIKGFRPDTVLDNKQKLRAMFRYMRKGLDAYARFGDRLEAMNRAALYEQVRQKGGTELEAALAARDVMDFSQSGAWPAVRFLTQVVPFLNARIQGLDVLYRKGFNPIGKTLYGTATDNEKAMAARFAVTTMMVGLASALLYLTYKDDEDFKKREDFDRDTYWWFKIGDRQFRIPKPFEIGAIGTIQERLLEQLVDDKVGGEAFAKTLWRALVNTFHFDPTPQLVKPILELAANKSSFTGRPIETMGMERLSSELRARPGTSGLGHMLSKGGGKYVGLSPVQIDHLVRGYFGWAGTQAMYLSDLVTRPLMDLPDIPVQQKRIPILGDIMERFSPEDPGNRYVTEFYETLKDIRQARADALYYRRIGDKEGYKREVAASRKYLAQSGRGEAVARKFAQISQAMQRIAQSDLSVEEKGIKMERLDIIKARLAKLMSEQLKK